MADSCIAVRYFGGRQTWQERRNRKVCCSSNATYHFFLIKNLKIEKANTVPGTSTISWTSGISASYCTMYAYQPRTYGPKHFSNLLFSDSFSNRSVWRHIGPQNCVSHLLLLEQLVFQTSRECDVSNTEAVQGGAAAVWIFVTLGLSSWYVNNRVK